MLGSGRAPLCSPDTTNTHTHTACPLPGMLLAQLMVTTISRSKRSQRVATAGRWPSGPAGSGMAYSFSGSTTSKWDTSAFTGAAETARVSLVHHPPYLTLGQTFSQSPLGFSPQSQPHQGRFQIFALLKWSFLTTCWSGWIVGGRGDSNRIRDGIWGPELETT